MFKGIVLFKHRTISNILLSIAIILGAFFALKVIKYAYDTKVQSYYNTARMPIGVTASETTKQLDCLTKNIYWEAATEPFEGKVAVAQVTLNRVNSGKFPSNVCAVVYQKNVIYDKVVCQFSWFCEQSHKKKIVHPVLYNESQEVAKKVLLENFRIDGLKEALYYHADYVNPKWNLEKIGKIGTHIFYKGRNDGT